MERFELSDGRVIALLKGDLTTQEVDAVVNAANQRMLGGEGVDGAIHRAAGPELRRACEAVPEVRRGVRCPTGEARITPGFQLAARHVIHTVGPVYSTEEASSPLLQEAYQSCFHLASRNRLQSIAFPAVSCGAYGYPHKDAARIAIQAAVVHGRDLREIRFVLFSAADFLTWLARAEALLPARR